VPGDEPELDFRRNKTMKTMKQLLIFILGAYIAVSAFVMRGYIILCNNKEVREKFFAALDDTYD
jgi:Ni,Fe-hydrogenase I cytochrome b subunit